MSEREKVDTYTIPPNFAESGKWFSGRVSAGNVVEAAVMSLILLKILLQVPVDGRTKIYLGIIFILPVVIFAVIGVQGERLTAYLFHILCFLKNRRVLTTPSGRYQLERKRRIERREHKRRKKVQLINVNSKMRKNLFYFLTKKGRTFPLVKISFFERY